MSSDKFDFIITEIPENIDKLMIKSLRSAIKDIDIEDAVIINRLLKLNTDGVIEDSLSEDDLFEIGGEGLKVKKAIQDFLNESVSEVLVPRMYQENRTSSPLNTGDFSYMLLNDKTYAISGQQLSYYGSKMNSGYMYVLALSLSNLLAEFLSDD
jgi:hypothetical protein